MAWSLHLQRVAVVHRPWLVMERTTRKALLFNSSHITATAAAIVLHEEPSFYRSKALGWEECASNSLCISSQHEFKMESDFFTWFPFSELKLKTRDTGLKTENASNHSSSYEGF